MSTDLRTGIPTPASIAMSCARTYLEDMVPPDHGRDKALVLLNDALDTVERASPATGDWPKKLFVCGRGHVQQGALEDRICWACSPPSSRDEDPPDDLSLLHEVWVVPID